MLTSLELCAGAGGQALGLEQAGFNHVVCVEMDKDCVQTLRLNRNWRVEQADINHFSGVPFRGQIDLLAGGLPCPPFSVAGKQLGELDERNLFPATFRLIDEIQPRAVLIENVKGLFAKSFDSYRNWIDNQFSALGYISRWKLFNACDFGVSQFRLRVLCVAIRVDLACDFEWPSQLHSVPPSVGETLFDLMASGGWIGASAWAERANRIGPTLVGGSKKHGGPDLGPTRAKLAWKELGVDGHGIANDVPDVNFLGHPKLTVRMAARLQGFPDDWQFYGRKTASYRQVGNAFPSPVAAAVGRQLVKALSKKNVYPVRAVA